MRSRLVSAYGSLPLSFEANRGQASANVRYLAHGDGYTLLLTSIGATLAIARPQRALSRLPGSFDPRFNVPGQHPRVNLLQMRFVGANAHATIVGVRRLPGVANYFIGPNPRHWHTHIPLYAEVLYRGLYPGIDLAYHGTAGRLEYDLDLRPGADPRAITLAIAGAGDVRLDTRGDLLMTMRSGEVRQASPTVYQPLAGRRRFISSRYVLMGRKRVGIALGAYNHHAPLVIDPVLDYATYVGGSSLDYATGIAVDGAGNAYITGLTWSTDFPTTTGAYSVTNAGGMDAFVTKLNASGAALVYSTYLGGPSVDAASGIAVDSAGDAYVAGVTNGSFPTTTGAAQTVYGGNSDGFVTKLNATGSALLYSTYLGGSGLDTATGLAIDSSGNAYVNGYTTSGDFPTVNAFQPTLAGYVDAFVTKLNAAGSALVYSTYLGGGFLSFGEGIAVDGSGHAYVTGATDGTSATFPITNAVQATSGGGFDAFVTEFTPSGNGLVFSTFLGGNGSDKGIGIAVGSQGGIYVAGTTDSISNTFPITNAIQATPGGGEDAFVAKLYPGGKPLLYSTFLGGNGDDEAYHIAVDGSGDAYVVGATDSISNTFPITNAVQATPGGSLDAFVAKINPYGTALVYSTFLGGSYTDAAYGVAVDSAGNAYVAGETYSPDFPTTTGAYSTTLAGHADAFVAKIGNS